MNYLFRLRQKYTKSVNETTETTLIRFLQSQFAKRGLLTVNTCLGTEIIEHLFLR